jgi:hypothetical protein
MEKTQIHPKAKHHILINLTGLDNHLHLLASAKDMIRSNCTQLKISSLVHQPTSFSFGNINHSNNTHARNASVTGCKGTKVFLAHLTACSYVNNQLATETTRFSGTCRGDVSSKLGECTLSQPAATHSTQAGTSRQAPRCPLLTLLLCIHMQLEFSPRRVLQPVD